LRDKQDPAVAAYLEAENAYTDAVMQLTTGLQEALYREMLGRIQETDESAPHRQRGFWYSTRTEEGKQYPLLLRRPVRPDAPPQLILDVNALAEGKPFMALGLAMVSDDDRLLAYSTDETGFRQYTLQVKDLEAGGLLPLRVEKVVTAAWAADSRTLFYTVEDEAKRSHRLYRHELGTDRHELVFEEPDERFNVYVGRTRSNAWLVLAVSSHTTSEVRLLPAAEPRGAWRLVAPRVQDQEYELDHQGGRFLIRVNDTGRNFRLVEAPVDSPGRESWRELVPHRPEVMLEGLDAFAGFLVLLEREGGLQRLRVLVGDGSEHAVAFPEPAYALEPSANAEYDTRLFRYVYQSLTTPASVFDWDVDARQATLVKRQPVLGGYDPERYATERLFATAPDGVRVPISIVYRRDFARDGSRPLHLYGYGSYGYSMPASFSSNRVSLLERGFACAIAHVRGGGELGKPWHDAGRMAKKPRTFSDFVACAELLVAQGYTRPERLVIEGGSAGGLLMGAVVNQRPELFAAVVSKVPFVDVINTMLDESLPLTVGEFEEWGNPKLPEQYAVMRAYCPYSNLAPGPRPAMLVKTAFHDSQVMYWEPAKYVARLRTLKTDPRPLLLKTNLAAGHGGASGRYDYLREVAFDFAFVLTAVGIDL
jgi:oligopeptidase B